MRTVLRKSVARRRLHVEATFTGETFALMRFLTRGVVMSSDGSLGGSSSARGGVSGGGSSSDGGSSGRW